MSLRDFFLFCFEAVTKARLRRTPLDFSHHQSGWLCDAVLLQTIAYKTFCTLSLCDGATLKIAQPAVAFVLGRALLLCTHCWCSLFVDLRFALFGLHS